MSRVAKKIINIPEGVNVSLTGNDVSVNSAKGTLNFVLTKEVSLKIDANEISVIPVSYTHLTLPTKRSV